MTTLLKRIIVVLALIVSTKAADVTLSLSSSNQLKIATNTIYSATLANLATLSNAIIGNIYVSSNALITTNWTALNASTVTAPTIASESSITSSNLVVTNLLTANTITATATLTAGAATVTTLTATNAAIFRTSIQVGSSGTALMLIKQGTAILDFGSIASTASEDLTITVAGAVVGNPVTMALPASPAAGIIFNAFVSATDTVTIRASNITAVPVDPASASYTVQVFKQ